MHPPCASSPLPQACGTARLGNIATRVGRRGACACQQHVAAVHIPVQNAPAVQEREGGRHVLPWSKGGAAVGRQAARQASGLAAVRRRPDGLPAAQPQHALARACAVSSTASMSGGASSVRAVRSQPGEGGRARRQAGLVQEALAPAVPALPAWHSQPASLLACLGQWRRRACPGCRAPSRSTPAAGGGAMQRSTASWLCSARGEPQGSTRRAERGWWVRRAGKVPHLLVHAGCGRAALVGGRLGGGIALQEVDGQGRA